MVSMVLLHLATPLCRSLADRCPARLAAASTPRPVPVTLQRLRVPSHYRWVFLSDRCWSLSDFCVRSPDTAGHSSNSWSCLAATTRFMGIRSRFPTMGSGGGGGGSGCLTRVGKGTCLGTLHPRNCLQLAVRAGRRVPLCRVVQQKLPSHLCVAYAKRCVGQMLTAGL